MALTRRPSVGGLSRCAGEAIWPLPRPKNRSPCLETRVTLQSANKDLGKDEPGEGPGVRINSSSVALAVVSRPRVVTHSNPSPEYQFLDTSRTRGRPQVAYTSTGAPLLSSDRWAASSTRTTRKEDAPSVSGRLPSATHSTKWRHSTSRGSTMGTCGM